MFVFREIINVRLDMKIALRPFETSMGLAKLDSRSCGLT